MTWLVRIIRSHPYFVLASFVVLGILIVQVFAPSRLTPIIRAVDRAISGIDHTLDEVEKKDDAIRELSRQVGEQVQKADALQKDAAAARAEAVRARAERDLSKERLRKLELQHAAATPFRGTAREALMEFQRRGL